MSRILLYNHGGCENRGCEAIVRSTAALFAKRNVTVLLATDQKAYDQLLGLDDVKRVFSSTISPMSVSRLVNSVAFRLGASRESEVARKYSPVIRAGKNSICLSVGGDTYCYGRQEHLYVINRRLKRAGRPTVLWCCSIEPDIINGELLEDLASYDLIVARESITFDALREAGLPAMLCCDPAFTLKTWKLPLPDGWRSDSSAGTVGINVSPLVLDRAKDRRAAVDAFIALIRHILETSNDAVALVPHVTWEHDNDLDALNEIREPFVDERRVIMLPATLDAQMLKGYIARMKALVTARTHASIAGYSSCVPTLVIGYSVKARGIARDLFGSEEGHLLPVQELHAAEQLIGAYDALLARAQEERSYLINKLPEYRRGLDEAAYAVMKLEG